MLENAFFVKITNITTKAANEYFLSREKTLKFMKNFKAENNDIYIESFANSRYFIVYDEYSKVWDICKHANGYSRYYGRSYKTPVAALNKLEKLIKE